MLISVALMTQLHLLYKNLKIKKKSTTKEQNPQTSDCFICVIAECTNKVSSQFERSNTYDHLR